MLAPLPIAKMTVAEKLRAREARIKAGKSVFADWPKAKDVIRKRTR